MHIAPRFTPIHRNGVGVTAEDPIALNSIRIQSYPEPAMHLSADIHSLTDFKTNAKEHLARIRSTGRPEILTVNGRAEAVVLPPALYDRLVELALGEVRAKIGLGLAQADRGELLDADAALAARRARRETKHAAKASSPRPRNAKPRRST